LFDKPSERRTRRNQAFAEHCNAPGLLLFHWQRIDDAIEIDDDIQERWISSSW